MHSFFVCLNSVLKKVKRKPSLHAPGVEADVAVWSQGEAHLRTSGAQIAAQVSVSAE